MIDARGRQRWNGDVNGIGAQEEAEAPNPPVRARATSPRRHEALFKPAGAPGLCGERELELLEISAPKKIYL